MKVRYLDGLTSHEHLADLNLEPAGLRLHYVDTDGSLQEAYWPSDSLALANIHPGRPIYLNRADRPGAAIRFETLADFSRVTAAYPHRPLLRNASGQFSADGHTRRIIIYLLVALLATGILGFVALERFGGLVAYLVPRSWETKAGTALYNSMSGQGEVKENKRASAVAQRFFKATGYTSEYPIALHVSKSEEVNAFALPGGPIIVNRGLIEKVNGPDELAGVLAHELGHVELRHTFQHLARMGMLYTLMSALVGDVSGVVAVIVDNGQAIFGLSYSRKMEADADAFAVGRMRAERLDPKGMLRFFKVLQKEEGHGASDLPDMLRSHPATPERMAEIRSLIPARYSLDTARRSRLARLLMELKKTL